MSEPYNYEKFPVDLDDPLFEAFPSGLSVGHKVPDGVLTRLSDGRARPEIGAHRRRIMAELQRP